MSILKYVQVHRASELPNPEGSLSKTMSAVSIRCANEEVRMVKEAAAQHSGPQRCLAPDHSLKLPQ